MIADILPQVTGGILDSVVRAFQKPPATRRLDREIREGTVVFGMLRSILADEREAAARELRDGVEATSFVARHKPAVEGLERFFAAAPEMRTGFAEMDKHPGAAALIAEFAAAEAEAVALRDRLAEAFRKATAPFPKIDVKKLKEQIQADREAGRLVQWDTMEDIIRDLAPPEEGGAKDAL